MIMNSYFLEGDEIALRPLTINDLTQEYLDWLNDKEVNHYSFRRFSFCSEAQLKSYLESLPSRNDEMHFAIIIKPEGKHVGNIGLKSIHSQARFAELGILIGCKEFWGRGIAVQSIRLLQDYAFNRLNLNRLEMGSFNPAAIKAYEKAGWLREGIQRERIYIDGKYHDEVRMALLASEFFSQ